MALLLLLPLPLPLLLLSMLLLVLRDVSGSASDAATNASTTVHPSAHTSEGSVLQDKRQAGADGAGLRRGRHAGGGIAMTSVDVLLLLGRRTGGRLQLDRAGGEDYRRRATPPERKFALDVLAAPQGLRVRNEKPTPLLRTYHTARPCLYQGRVDLCSGVRQRGAAAECSSAVRQRGAAAEEYSML